VTKSNGVITGIAKEREISLSVAFYGGDITSGTLNVYLYITYDNVLVTDFGKSIEIEESSGEATELYNDIESIEVVFGH
ncbi:MAG: hypothetical protein J6W87_04230, partial [Clostridia bacterium]|nr:hypothetical protein [Clostridia bacterium]